jgi:superfamily II DNA or RNA helicase
MIRNLSEKGYSIYKSDLDNINEIKNELTVKAFIPDGYGQEPNSFQLFQEGPNKLYVPKSYGLKKFGQPTHLKYSDEENINLEFNGTIRKEQEEPIQKFLDACKNPLQMGGILNLPCAFGKTTMTIYIITQLKVKTLIVVHKDFLLQQWKDRILQFAPNARIGYIKAKVIDVENKDIVIGSLQSLSMKSYDNKIFQGMSFIVVDETHHIGSEVFSRALRKLTFKYTLGLSATIIRKDGLSKVFHWYLGETIFSIKKRNDNVNVIIKSYYSDHKDYSTEHLLYNNKPCMPKMINNICNFQPRIEFLREIVVDILKNEPDRKILLLSDRRNHLENIKDLFEKHNMSCGLYYGGLKQAELKISETKQILLATFNMTAEGFDLPSLNTLILASPKSDIIQASGRILREKEEVRKYKPLIIDIVDKFSIFPNQAKKRLLYYNKSKYDIL